LIIDALPPPALLLASLVLQYVKEPCLGLLQSACHCYSISDTSISDTEVTIFKRSATYGRTPSVISFE